MSNDLVKEGYNQVAEQYLSERDQFKNNKYLEKLAELLKQGATVLDIGCGAGTPVDRFLVDKNFQVKGIDISEKQIELARKNIPEGTFTVADMLDLREGEYLVDAVVSFYAVSHTPREGHEELFKKFNSYLQDGGLLLITMGSSDNKGGEEEDFYGTKMYWSHYPSDKNTQLVKNSGFEILIDEIDDAGGERHQVILARKSNE